MKSFKADDRVGIAGEGRAEGGRWSKARGICRRRSKKKEAKQRQKGEQNRDHRQGENEDRTEKLWISRESRKSEVPEGSDQPIAEESDAMRQQVKKRFEG